MISIKNNLLVKIFYPIFYILFAASITLSVCFIVQKNAYINIYVSGTSMKPTLMGDINGDRRVHYGIADTSVQVKQKLKRFDVVVTYFPESWGTGSTMKVKRVWGFPGETIELKTDTTEKKVKFTVYKDETVVSSYQSEALVNKEFTFEKYDIENGNYTYNTNLDVFPFNTGEKTFDINYSERNCKLTLKENEYFLMGDNWASSTDSYEKRFDPNRITFSNIQGKVVRIEGTARLDNQVLIDKKVCAPKYNF